MNAEIWSFDNDELFDLVKSGNKTATCALYLPGNKTPQVGEESIIENSNGDQIKIKLTNVSIRKFCDIDEQWAKKEGEGNLSLAYWQKIHTDFFTKQCCINGLKFAPEIELLCEEFITNQTV